MALKISTATLRLFRHFGTETGIRLLADAGFEAMDYTVCQLPWNHTLFQDAPIAEVSAYYKQIAQLAKDCGLDIFQTHAAFPLKVFDPENDPAMLRSGIRHIYATAYLNCPNIVFHPALHPDFNNGKNAELCRAVNLEFFSAMAPALKDTGVTLCIENMFTGENGKPKIPNACSTPEQMIDLIDTLNSMHGPHFAACLDTGHAAVVGQDPAAMLRKLGSRTQVLHIHDNNGILDQHLLPGEGIIDWDDVTGALSEIGYTGTFNTEASMHFVKCTQEGVHDEKLALDISKQLYTLCRPLADRIH